MRGADPKKMAEEQKMKNLMIKLTAGGFAGMTTWFFAYPFDVVKSVSQQVSASLHFGQDKRPSMIKITQYLWRNHGLKVFFHGLSSCLVRAFVVNSICLVSYEECVKKMNRMLP